MLLITRLGWLRKEGSKKPSLLFSSILFAVLSSCPWEQLTIFLINHFDTFSYYVFLWLHFLQCLILHKSLSILTNLKELLVIPLINYSLFSLLDCACNFSGNLLFSNPIKAETLQVAFHNSLELAEVSQ